MSHMTRIVHLYDFSGHKLGNYLVVSVYLMTFSFLFFFALTPHGLICFYIPTPLINKPL